MIGKIVTGLIGKRVAERYANHGFSGALIGAAAPFVLRRALGPVGLAIGGGYLAKKAYDSRRRRQQARA